MCITLSHPSPFLQHPSQHTTLTTISRRRIPYCTADPPPCDQDTTSFHVTNPRNHLRGNDPSFRYDLVVDNLYAYSSTLRSIQQCVVQVQKKTDAYTVTLFSGNNQQVGTTSLPLPNTGDSLTVPGAPILPYDLIMTKIASVEGLYFPVTFSYGVNATPPTPDDLRYKFAWRADQRGSSTQVDNEGHYCDIVDEGSRLGKMVRCGFPCSPP